MHTKTLKQTKQLLTVSDYVMLNNYRINLEIEYNRMVNFESNTVLCKIVDEINKLRNHLNMDKL
ncbi:hypothetical protein [Tenacibaculum phage JQ]|nr:hypothetical protein [Tenacibaculum phage JQ]